MQCVVADERSADEIREQIRSLETYLANTTKGLKKVYNRARQENITKELLDIIGGASAVS